ncbi:quinone-dependent dihydroorotate dehydrogenase [Candidatus Uhrbacteria bacterium CG10_big_fil_rev_8_21_14_0_10_48_16]|uniref:Dihydroorotate dehydrogenase (quinone) n=1 Tax=Candidatus Uhrbacteria bacterium CG10_big_fil_rev_8_21_14_0_10_48_16 TaxID=1975038 RepID=A0A2M8LHY9_9BACT|nr:MAG: quinone-dependent dihydroorotate dehydrogenase [Candidatus Uhrbacteria bacterium CG10_big_fil_rev_8_21_14_0_10_48_16]
MSNRFLFMFATNIQRWGYQHVLKPFFFRCDPEWTHDQVCEVGERFGRSRLARGMAQKLCAFQDDSLHQEILGIHFSNPIGLTEGFDKNARLTQILPSIGFGYEIVGSVTAQACKGNAKPRLWRLPKSKGLVVYYGLMNDGGEAIRSRLSTKTFAMPIGISIAKTNCPGTVETQSGIEDYVQGFTTMRDTGDFFVINISCPNAFGGEPFSDPKRLEALLSRLDGIETSKPIFIKSAVDLTIEELDALIAVMDRHRVHGIILSNLTKQYGRREIVQDEIQPHMKGGISGRPTYEASNTLIAHTYLEAGDRYVIIGVGGVFTAEDAYEKIRQGASLVQLATGMIFEGPQLIGELNRGLAQLLHRDGFNSISEVVGSAHRS